MDGFLPLVGVLVVCVMLVLTWPTIRRQVLSREGSVFDCELNPDPGAETPWELGLARCNGDDLEWFPRHGLSFRPRHTLSRAASGIRAQTRAIAPDGLNGQRVLHLEAVGTDPVHSWELALDVESHTALLAWLEAAPPSVGRFRS